jgi:hypothetical protein
MKINIKFVERFTMDQPGIPDKKDIPEVKPRRFIPPGPNIEPPKRRELPFHPNPKRETEPEKIPEKV